MRTRIVFVLAGAMLGALLLPAPAHALIPPDTKCRAGKVAMTFDDGPHRVNTARLLKVLRKQRAQSTFYVQGQHAKRYPSLLRQMVRDGHAVENHSWNHPDLTTLSGAQVRHQLSSTTKSIHQATGRTPKFFRPPYGATDGRIVAIARDLGLRQQLWTIDTRDWAGSSGATIAHRALTGLRKNRTNVILLHDGIGNSPRTIDAVPRIVEQARKRGYCFAPQQAMMARQKPRIQSRKITEPKTASVVRTFTVKLDSPAQRRGRVLVTTVDGSARAGTHYRKRRVWVTFRRGQKTTKVKVRILRAADDHADRAFQMMLSRPRGLKVTTKNRATRFVIRDNGVVTPKPPPTSAPPTDPP